MDPLSQVVLSLPFGSQQWTIPSEGVITIAIAEATSIDLSTAVDHALSAPIDFASVDQAIVQGDSVALAVDPETPCLVPVVGAISRWLVEHGTEPQNLCIVLVRDEGVAQALSEHLDRLGLKDVTICLHDANDPETHSYVAANDEAEPVYVNRRLVDADVIIPVSCARSKHAVDYLGAFGIFPLFSNRETRGQFHCYGRLVQPTGHDKLLHQADQVAWYLGLLVGVQVIPAADDHVAGILCGSMTGVERAAQAKLLESRQQYESLTNPVDLVIALVDGSDPSWTGVARALQAAKRFCCQGGTIVLCTQLHQPIGASLRRLSDAHSSRPQIEKRLSRDAGDDTLAASVILNTISDHHIYLVSELRPAAVEELGLGVLDSAAQLAGVVQQHTQKLVLHSAQHP